METPKYTMGMIWLSGQNKSFTDFEGWDRGRQVGPFFWNRESWDRTSPLPFTSYWSGTRWFFSEHHVLTSA